MLNRIGSKYVQFGNKPRGVHKQVWDCFPKLWSLHVLPSTFQIPQTPLQGPLSRTLAGAFFVLLCGALRQLHLHPGPRESRTEGEKCNGGWLHPLRTTASVKEEGFSFLGILFPVSSHYRPPPRAYSTITWGLGMREQEKRERGKGFPLPGFQSIQLRLQHKHRGKEGGEKGKDWQIHNQLGSPTNSVFLQ